EPGRGVDGAQVDESSRPHRGLLLELPPRALLPILARPPRPSGGHLDEESTGGASVLADEEHTRVGGVRRIQDREHGGGSRVANQRELTDGPVRETHPGDGQVNHAPVVDEATAEIPGLRAFGVDGRRRLREVGRRQYVWLVVHCWNGRETRSGPAVPVAGPPPGPRSRNSRVRSSP